MIRTITERLIPPAILKRIERAPITPFEQGLIWLTVGWVLSLIGLPILKAVLGEGALPIGVSGGVLLQAMTIWAILVWTWGTRRAVLVSAILLIGAWGIEYIGHTTGFPFGSYAYTDRLQPQLGGVPLLIPLAWLIMLPSAWAVARRIAQHEVPFVLVSALAFTVWDLFLDPQMVGWNLWTWAQPSGYFGIPVTNFVGWLITSALLTALASKLAPLRELPSRPLITLYAITWALEVIGQVSVWGLPGSGLVGGAAMGLMLLWALKSRPL